MATLTETSNFDAGIYKIETTDLVLGGDGVGDIANQQAKALANRTKWLKDNLYRLSDVIDIAANTTLVNTDANKLNQLSASSHITITMPAVSGTVKGDRFPFSSIMTAGKCATIAAADTIKYADGDTRTNMYLYSGERLELISAGTYWLVGDCYGNFDRVGESFGARKQKGNTLVADGSLVNRSDYPRLFEFVSSLTTGHEVVTDANWLGGIGGETNTYRGCFSLGNGTTTFRLPDERGLFNRYLDLTRGLDSGRLHEYAGGFEDMSLQLHTHNTTIPLVQHTATSANVGVTDGPLGSPSTRVFASSATGSDQTRPKNIGKIPLIVY